MVKFFLGKVDERDEGLYSMEQKNKEILLQFLPEANYPVFIKCHPEEFQGHFLTFLGQCQFKELPKKARDSQAANPRTYERTLHLKLATPALALRMGTSKETDRFGPESVGPLKGHFLYRYQGQALLFFSEQAKEWEMAVFKEFGHPDQIKIYRTMINRFLSWALAPLGIVGFWGIPFSEGILVMKQKESQGEAVFVDWKQNLLLSSNGVKKNQGIMEMARLDLSLQGRKRKMSKEELFGFLSLHSTYLGMENFPFTQREILEVLSHCCSGVVYPHDTLRLRTGLTF